MAKAIAHITCSECGTEFKRTKICRNSDEAEKWEAYAEQHGGLCEECYRKHQHEENAEKASSYDLPEITGKSEKQIAYAQDLRNRYVNDHAKHIAKAIEIRDAVNDDQRAKLEAEARENGMELAEMLETVLKAHHMRDEYTIATSADARTIIDLIA